MRSCVRHAPRARGSAADGVPRHQCVDSPSDRRPAAVAARATEALAGSDGLLLADLSVAECVYVLESFYEVPRERVAELMRAAIALPTIKALDSATLLRALEVYEVDRLDFAEAYLVAQAEATGIEQILSFDKSIDRISTITRHEP